MGEQGGNLQEAAAFLWMICYGLACGFLFDVMAFVRRLLKPGGFSSFFIDLFYCLAVGAGFLLFLYAGWHGDMRVYWLLGAVLGFGLYHVGPGRAIRRTFYKWAGKLRRNTGRVARSTEEKINEIAAQSRRKMAQVNARRRKKMEQIKTKRRQTKETNKTQRRQMKEKRKAGREKKREARRAQKRKKEAG